MLNRLKGPWLNISQSLGFVPGLLVAVFGILGIVLVEVDQHLDLDGMQAVFAGDASAARTVLSVIAGSLITVAGLTFSTTISCCSSPRASSARASCARSSATG